jgi:hypothetical protein
VVTVAGSWQPDEPRGPQVTWTRSTWVAALPGPVTYDRHVAVSSVWDPDDVLARNHIQSA